jgi:acyl carrier protein
MAGPTVTRRNHRKAGKCEESTVSDETFDRFRKCAVEVLAVDEAQVVPGARFGDDLDADSLDLVELVMALEEEFDINVDEAELDGVESVGQALELVRSKI